MPYVNIKITREGATAEQKAAVPGRSQSYARFANWEPFGL